jgi:hypothetical protein
MADDKHTRVIPLDDKLLLSMVTQKGEMVEKGRALAKAMEALAKQHEKLHDEMTAITAEVTNKKLDIFKRVEKLAKKLVGEFEIPVTTEIPSAPPPTPKPRPKAPWWEPCAGMPTPHW